MKACQCPTMSIPWNTTPETKADPIPNGQINSDHL
jgi:hypothetical protein